MSKVNYRRKRKRKSGRTRNRCGDKHCTWCSSNRTHSTRKREIPQEFSNNG